MLELEAQAQSTNPLGGWAGTTGDALGSEESAEAIAFSEQLVAAAEVSRCILQPVADATLGLQSLDPKGSQREDGRRFQDRTCYRTGVQSISLAEVVAVANAEKQQ